MSSPDPEPFPPYAFVPGGPWPHPVSSPEGHSFGHPPITAEPIAGDDWSSSVVFLRGVGLFNAGYYWEAHEAWEALWHAHGRRGPTADLLKGLIKLAAAGVKVRERQSHGVVTHARRSALLFRMAREQGGDRRLGLDLARLEALAYGVTAAPPTDPAPPGARVSRVFSFRIEPC
jgi:hypothetical protein